eukprot:scaffold28357_cov63-Phaeocystis_antarctica.AAC.3
MPAAPESTELKPHPEPHPPAVCSVAGAEAPLPHPPIRPLSPPEPPNLARILAAASSRSCACRAT